MPINWCPSCKTGLANEEVAQGKCDRCGSTGGDEKICGNGFLGLLNMQTDCLEDLSEVDWPESTLAMQRNWIGRSEGAEVVFYSS